MKKLVSITLALVLTLGMLAGCTSQQAPAPSKTPEELTQLYAQTITEHGGEAVEHNPVISEVEADDMLIPIILESLSLTEDDMAAFGISMSMINTQAYGIVAIMPAEGREQAVLDGLQTHIDSTCRAFEHYIPGNKEIAEATRLETLKDGTILMVMCENQDEIFDAIKAAIEG